jgi:hypothetical protein
MRSRRKDEQKVGGGCQGEKVRRSYGKDKQEDKKENDNGEKMRRSCGKDEQEVGRRMTMVKI